VKEDVYGVFTPEMLKLPQATWIETFLEGVPDKIIELLPEEFFELPLAFCF
jgi:hypothetical protein